MVAGVYASAARGICRVSGVSRHRSDPAARYILAGALLAWSFGCAEAVELDPDETGAFLQPPRASFDPQNRRVPLPNALLMDAATGTIDLPDTCAPEPGTAAAELRATLERLDGFGTSQMRLVAPLEAPVDTASLPGRVFVVRLAEGGAPLEQFEDPVPVDAIAGSSTEIGPDCVSSVQVPNLTLLPREPLQGSSTYAVVLLAGIESERGVAFEPSATWALTRQADPPVVFSESDPERVIVNATPFDAEDPEQRAGLEGLERLWRAHAPLLATVDRLAPALAPEAPPGRADILLAWAFDTQTLAEPFDASIVGSPAALSSETSVELSLPTPAAGAGGALGLEEFFAAVVPGAPCAALGCEAIGAVYAATELSTAPSFTAPSFLQGDDCEADASSAPGAFSDPLQPELVCERQLPLVVVTPVAPAGEAGYPTIVFAHGLGRSKEDLLLLAGALARAGFASVAFDAVDHGSRAVRVSTDAALGCDGAGPGNSCTDTIAPTCAPQCFAPLLSPNLAVTRDHLRQTVLDQLKLERVLAACATPEACGALHVDPERIGYVGQSLGALLGGVSAAVSEHLGAAVLNVGGADWVRVLSETATPAIRCPLVDSLITAGVLSGTPWAGGNPQATCLGQEWTSDPRFIEFAAAARWILDPVDPINYANRYGASDVPTLLVAEVEGDTVVPNSATQLFASAVELAPEAAAAAAEATPEPTAAAVRAGSSWIVYAPLEADPSAMFPGNAYAHGSLLSPVAPSTEMSAESGRLGTAQMQVDTVAFLGSHL